MVVQAGDGVLRVEASSGYDGEVYDITIYGYPLPTNCELYKDIMDRPHMLPGLIECKPGTVINAVAVMLEWMSGEEIRCDGSITIPIVEGRVY